MQGIPLHRVVLRPDQTMHLGTGRGSGFSRASRTYVPGSTLRGAACAAWWLRHPTATQEDFDRLVAGIAFSDATVSQSPQAAPVNGLPLDRRLCKHPAPGCPSRGHAWAITTCPTCKGPTEPSKGERVLNPDDAHLVSSTRVSLSATEQAVENHLFERQGLRLHDTAHLLAYAAGDVDQLLSTDHVLRLGASRSVAGRATVIEVAPIDTPTLSLNRGTHRLRVELLTGGVYVDDFGFAVAHPSPYDLRCAFDLPQDAEVTVERGWTRWTKASGWHTQANVPKPEDAAVVANSAFHISLALARQARLPALVHTLGLRTGEGFGWAQLETLADDAAPISETEVPHA